MSEPGSAGPEASGRRWTVLSLLEWADGYLREKSFEESRLNAELLLAHVLGLPRLGLYLQFDRPLLARELAAFKALLLRRITHEPLQYIVGETEFMGLRFLVTPAVLIPRPETEQLVEEVIRWMKRSGPKPGSILEIGTGSGNIAAALAKFLPGVCIRSIEKSPEALALARRNCERLGMSGVELIEGDVFAPEFDPGVFDAVVSNPPYIPAAEFDLLQEEVRRFEPRMAASDGGDGYLFIRRISGLARSLLRPGGALFMEIGHGQAEAAGAIARDSGLGGVRVMDDFAGIGRILTGFAPGGAEGA